MQGAMRRLLEGAIDYAGLFPPAKLSMPAAVEEYIRYRHGPEAWILDRFVCSAGRLMELHTELFEHSPDEVSGREPLSIAVVGSVHPDHKHWAHGIEHDIAEMSRFQARAERRAELTAFEIRVPDHEHLPEYLRSLGGLKELDIFVELPWAPEMNDSLAAIAESGAFGAKARTGGIDAAFFPSSQDLASFIQECVHLDLQFKCTAGLHQPLHHLDKTLGAKMHGFVNVIAATVLADTEDLSKREIEEVLDEEQAGAFAISNDSLTWRGHRATVEQIGESRQLMIGFGSCSVEEPIEGLKQWLA